MDTLDISTEIKAVVRITQTQFKSHDQIMEVGGLTSCSKYLRRNIDFSNVIFAQTTSTDEEEILLYWSGKNESIPMVQMREYFNEKGFEIIKNTHPSLLVNAMAVLSEEKLHELGIPPGTRIILPTAKSSMIRYKSGNYCFLGVSRKPYRKLALYPLPAYDGRNSAFLLARKT